MTRPGYRTTEFWVTIFTAAANVANLTGVWDFISNYQSGLLLTVGTAAYAVARGLAKHGKPA